MVVADGEAETRVGLKTAIGRQHVDAGRLEGKVRLQTTTIYSSHSYYKMMGNGVVPK